MTRKSPKGSITIFLALMLCLMVSMIGAGIQSVRMAAARSQILNSMDIGLFSLFSEYDRTLLDEYDIFAIDASGSDGMLDPGSLYDEFYRYMLPVLLQTPSQKLIPGQGGISGFALLTDDRGEIFYKEVVQYMLETLWAQGITAAQSLWKANQASTQQAEEAGSRLDQSQTMRNYDDEIRTAASRSREKEEARRRAASEAVSEGTGQGFSSGSSSQGELFSSSGAAGESSDTGPENPIPKLQRIMGMDLLTLVIPTTKSISPRQLNGKPLLSQRQLQKGFGMEGWYIPESSFIGEALFQQYMISKLGSFQRPAKTGLAYQIEYIISRKKTDEENLRTVVNRLLLIREGVNAAAIASDPVKMDQVRALSAGIAQAFLAAPALVVIEAALVACWAFGESILDVRELLSGGRVPLIKSPADWQLALENLPDLLDRLDTDRKGNDNGLSYEDYLHVLLLGLTREDKTMGTMDMIEVTLRGQDGWESFSLDSCVAAAGMSVDVVANLSGFFSVSREFGYL